MYSLRMRVLVTGLLAMMALAGLWPLMAALTPKVRERATVVEGPRRWGWLGSPSESGPVAPAHRSTTQPTKETNGPLRRAAVAALYESPPPPAMLGSREPAPAAPEAPLRPTETPDFRAQDRPIELGDMDRRIDRLLAETKAGNDADARRAAAEIAHLGPAAIPTILTRLKETGAERVPILAASLLMLDAGAGASLLSAKLTGEDQDTALEALAALRLARNRQAIRLLIDAVEKQSPPVASRATEILRELAPFSSLRVEEALACRISGHENPWAAAQTLGTLGTNAALRELQDLASHSDRANGQIAALQALATLGDKVNPGLVAKAIRDARSNAVVRQAAITAGRLRIGPAVPDLMDHLVNEDAHDAQTLKDVAWALGEITGERLLPDPALWKQWWDSVGRHKDWNIERTDGSGLVR
jgi:HEAT repeat protein